MLQMIEVDVEMGPTCGPPGDSDDLAETVDYGAVFELCRAIVEDGSFHLLEAIADAIADRGAGRFRACSRSRSGSASSGCPSMACWTSPAWRSSAPR